MMTRPLPSEQLNIQPGENPVQAIHKLDLKGLQHELIKRQKTANIKGSKSVLRQRLRKTFEQQLFANTKAAQQAPPEEYLYLLVLDLETRTLEEQNTQIEDVIEFAVALFSVETLSIVSQRSQTQRTPYALYIRKNHLKNSNTASGLTDNLQLKGRHFPLLR